MRRSSISEKPNIINHIGLVLDSSLSMARHRHKVVEVADNQIKHLAKRSQELDQETRISVWTFSGQGSIRCVVWDKDVLRLPSIAKYYDPDGNTAFIDAMVQSLDDLGTTSQIYGDHSFLVYVLTDGEENSSLHRPLTLSNKIAGLADNWTVAALVPNMNGVHEAKRFGFPAGNIQVWDATTQQGLEEAAQSILDSADHYMVSRASGLRSTTGLFNMSSTAVNSQTIRAAGLKPLAPHQYFLVPVPQDEVIKDFTEKMGYTYVLGRGYYQLSKYAKRAVKIQPQKEIAVLEKKSSKIYVGENARKIVGLPSDTTISVRWDFNPDYDIFVQSTSVNRILLAGTQYLWLIK